MSVAKATYDALHNGAVTLQQLSELTESVIFSSAETSDEFGAVEIYYMSKLVDTISQNLMLLQKQLADVRRTSLSNLPKGYNLKAAREEWLADLGRFDLEKALGHATQVHPRVNAFHISDFGTECKDCQPDPELI